MRFRKTLLWLLVIPVFLACGLAPPRPTDAEWHSWQATQTVRQLAEHGDADTIEALARLRAADANHSQSPQGGVDIWKDGFSNGEQEGREDMQSRGSTTFLLGVAFALGVFVLILLAKK